MLPTFSLWPGTWGPHLTLSSSSVSEAISHSGQQGFRVSSSFTPSSSGYSCNCCPTMTSLLCHPYCNPNWIPHFHSLLPFIHPQVNCHKVADGCLTRGLLTDSHKTPERLKGKLVPWKELGLRIQTHVCVCGGCQTLIPPPPPFLFIFFSFLFWIWRARIIRSISQGICKSSLWKFKWHYMLYLGCNIIPQMLTMGNIQLQTCLVQDVK